MTPRRRRRRKLVRINPLLNQLYHQAKMMLIHEFSPPVSAAKKQTNGDPKVVGSLPMYNVSGTCFASLRFARYLLA